MELSDIGWDATFEAGLSPDDSCVPARVIREDRGMYQVLCPCGEFCAQVSGGFRHKTDKPSDFPTVGDWVACVVAPDGATAVIQSVLPRRGCFKRKVAGSRTAAQVVAANVDTAFVVSGLDGGRNFSVRRLERYLVLCGEGGAASVMVLNKADLCESTGEFEVQARAIASGVPVHVVSAKTGEGVDALFAYAGVGETIALLGSSGVGKSALINAMLGSERQATGAVRGDDRRGRHTTTRRELLLLPNGGMVIDTPGIRELQLWGDEDSVDETFADIDELAKDCRFNDCRHVGELGCAVQVALDDGVLDAGRYESYARLQREMAHLARRQDQRTRSNPKARWRELSKLQRQLRSDRG